MDMLFAGIITGAMKTIFWAGAIFAVLVIGVLYLIFHKKK